MPVSVVRSQSASGPERVGAQNTAAIAQRSENGLRTVTKHRLRRSIVRHETACYIQLRDAGVNKEGPRRK